MIIIMMKMMMILTLPRNLSLWVMLSLMKTPAAGQGLIRSTLRPAMTATPDDEL